MKTPNNEEVVELQELTFDQFRRMLEKDQSTEENVRVLELGNNLKMSFVLPANFPTYRKLNAQVASWAETWFDKYQKFIEHETSTGNVEMDKVFKDLYEKYPDPNDIEADDFYMCGIVKKTAKMKVNDVSAISMLLTRTTFTAIVTFIKPLFFGSELDGISKDLQTAGK